LIYPVTANNCCGDPASVFGTGLLYRAFGEAAVSDGHPTVTVNEFDVRSAPF
jgi:hypothetical protein